MAAATAVLEVVPVERSFQGEKKTEYDVVLKSRNGKQLWRDPQGYTRPEDAYRGIKAIHEAMSTATVVLLDKDGAALKRWRNIDGLR